VSYYPPNKFSSAQDPQGRAGDARIHQQTVINGNVGVEYRVKEDLPIRLGAFTNFSSSPTIGTTGASGSVIDYYGGTASISLIDHPFSTHIGAQAAYGKGEHLVGTGPQNFSLLHLTGMIGSSFHF